MYELYRHLARDVGLTMTPADPGPFTFVIELRGELEGRPVFVRRRCGRAARVYVGVSFAEPIALGLRVEPMRMLARLGRWLGRTELVTGDAGFDSACRARADDAERAKSVLTPELRAALASVPWADWTFDDAGFVAQARATAPVESAESLAAMLRHAATIAAVVERVCAPTGRP